MLQVTAVKEQRCEGGNVVSEVSLVPVGQPLRARTMKQAHSNASIHAYHS